jgi:hypothetical protein
VLGAGKVFEKKEGKANALTGADDNRSEMNFNEL